MLKKLTYIYLTWLLVILFVQLTGCSGCCPDDSDCVNVNKSLLTVYDNSGREWMPAGEDPVPGEAVVLELELQNDIYTCSRKSKAVFITSAYATSCRKSNIYNEHITYLSISADKRYGASHPATTELNDLFTIPSMNELNEDPGSKEKFRMFALKAPEESGLYTFTVKLLLSNGDIIEATANPVNILK